jgi:hypothetical protein
MNDTHNKGRRRAELLGSAASGEPANPLSAGLKATTVLDGYMTEEELAAEIGRGVRTLARWRSLGEGPPYVRLGRQLFYKRASASAWLAGLERDA